MNFKIKNLALAVSMLLGSSSAALYAEPKLDTTPVMEVEDLYPVANIVAPSLSAAGKFSVGVTTLNVENPSQLNVTDFKMFDGRELKLEVWYPAKDSKAKKTTYQNQTRFGKPFSLQANAYRDAKIDDSAKYPLIVLSHGYTGYRTIMFYLAEHLASHGYVVVGIDHTDSTNEDVDFVNDPFSGFVSTLYNRARDQQFVLDYFSNVDIAGSLSVSIDSDKAAIIGYSMGGYGAINTVGGCYDFSADKLAKAGFPKALGYVISPFLNSCSGGKDSVDSRWKAMVAMAPWGGEQGIHQQESLQKLNVPSLYVAGEQDDVSGYEQGVKSLYDQTGAKDKYLLVYENARHNFAPHPAPNVAYEHEADLGHYFEPSWNSVTLNNINKHMSLAFLNCHVKQLPSMCEMLPKTSSAVQVKQQDGTLTQAWPGFVDRWATGMRFYRSDK